MGILKNPLLQPLWYIFSDGEAARGRYPEPVITAAIERTVSGTDPRLRLLPGYRKRLRAPVTHALEYVVGLVAGMSAPLPAGRATHSLEPRLAALFASAADMLELFGRDGTLAGFLSSRDSTAGQVTALLLSERVEKNILGVELMGDVTRRDVPQVAVSFSRHRILDPGASEETTRRQLERRGFKHLLNLARRRIAEVRLERAALAHQRDVLRRRLRVTTDLGRRFEQGLGALAQAVTEISELDAITRRLDALGVNQGVLAVHLEIVAELLGQAERQFWREDLTLHLDAMNIRRDPQNPAARRIVLQEYHDARGRRFIPLLVRLAPGELPTPEAFITAAERCLLRPGTFK